MAVLQTARRLLAEGGDLLKDGWQAPQSRSKHTKYSMTGALRAGCDLAHPADRDKSLYFAQHALVGALTRDEKSALGIGHLPDPYLTRFEHHPDTTIEDALRVYDAAIKNQGAVNVSKLKGKGRK